MTGESDTVTTPDAGPAAANPSPARNPLLIDPRRGDVENDISATKERSLFAIAGGMLVEISLPKLLLAWTLSLLLPAVLLGLAPLVMTAWIATVSERVQYLTGISAAVLLVVVLAIGWFGWRPLFRIAEVNFWSLNALAIQPAYVLYREALRHLAERALGARLTVEQRSRLRAASSAGAGVILCAFAVLVAWLVWPFTRWIGDFGDLVSAYRLMIPTVANATVLVCAYLAVASLVWGFADATMDQPQDFTGFAAPATGGRSWRVAHLSDIHIVGERYGFRIESGRGGPRGNERLERVLTRLDAIHAADPLDLVLISGDMTDAGLASEWAEFFDAVARHPALKERMLILPGNHDLNIVDRANPARLDLPFSPGKRLRQMRTLSAMVAIQGDRVRVLGDSPAQSQRTLNEALAGEKANIVVFADRGGLGRSARLRTVLDDQFPMLLPPDSEDGLGVVILNSNAQSNFSFTNALGMISIEQGRRLGAAVAAYPKAHWIVALHHHLMEYPMPGVAFADRIGTALVNGSWFVRMLKPFGGRLVVMHGHRHIDWIGACGPVTIVSAPSPVMDATDFEPTHFHILTLAAGPGGRLLLRAPERIDIAGDPPSSPGASSPGA